MEKKSEKKSPMYGLQKILFKAFIIVALVYGIFGWVLGVITAPNNDMFPRVDAGDLLLYYRLSNEIKSQDIVVLRKNKTTYIGRVVAKPGDTVKITKDEQLFINGNEVSESNIFYKTPLYEGFVEYSVALKEGEYFILADYRNGGEDSRYYGPVDRTEIKGVVITLMRRNNL